MNPHTSEETGKSEAADESTKAPDLSHQPLWIKVAALIVAITALVALAVLYVVRLGGG